MPESFGVRLRQQRERRHVGLAAIAQQTKIKQSLLEELERDNVSHWPAGIFRRAFIRAYALAIGLEPDVVVREFLEVHPDPVEVVETLSAAAPATDGSRPGAGPRTRFRYFVDSAIGSFARLGFRTAPKGTSTIDGVEAVRETPAEAPPPAEPDLQAIALVCTDLGRLDETREAAPLLQQAARILDAVGLIVWTWDPRLAELKPTLAHGYSDEVLAQLPRVRRDADNATAAALRSAQVCVVNGNERTTGALVVPLMTPGGCVGVLAIELRSGSERRPSVRAAATIFAAQLARLVASARPAETADRRLA